MKSMLKKIDQEREGEMNEDRTSFALHTAF